MRVLWASALAANVIGCTCLIPPQTAQQECVDARGLPCLARMAAAPQDTPRPAPARDDHLARPATKHTAKKETPLSVQSGDKPDPVLVKAKATIAAKMEDPDSAEFGEMKRAVRKNTLGKRIDTICGSVKGKNASGGDIGERPFLYLVQEDEAYVVDSNGEGMAAIAYRNICR